MFLEVNLAIFTVSLIFFAYSITRWSIKRLWKSKQSTRKDAKNYDTNLVPSQPYSNYLNGNAAYAQPLPKPHLNASLSPNKLLCRANFRLLIDYFCFFATILLWLGYFEQLQVYGGIHLSHGQLFEVPVLHHFLFFLIDNFLWISCIALGLELVRWLVLKNSNHWMISLSATSLSLVAPALNQSANNITLFAGLMLTSILVYVNSMSSTPISSPTSYQLISSQNDDDHFPRLHSPANPPMFQHSPPPRHQSLPQFEEKKTLANKYCWREPRRNKVREATPARRIRQFIEQSSDLNSSRSSSKESEDESKGLKENFNIFTAKLPKREELFPRKCRKNSSSNSSFVVAKEQTPTREICRILKKIDLKLDDMSMQ